MPATRPPRTRPPRPHHDRRSLRTLAPEWQIPVPPPVPAALVLTAASYDRIATTITLTFDRAIDVSHTNAPAIVVADAMYGRAYRGNTSPTVLSPDQVRFGMIDVGPFVGDATVLEATNSSGIVAVDDGGTWAGAVHLPLPLPDVPLVELTMVAASFDVDGPILYVTFDRAVYIGAIDLSQFAVNDGPDNGAFVGQTAAMSTAEQVAVTMFRVGDFGGADQLMTVGSGNGVEAVDDGGTWSGVTDQVLPVP